MMKFRYSFVLAIALILAAPVAASAQSVPAEVPVQGFLTDDSGVPVDGSVTVKFAIYDAAVSGTELYSEEQTISADAGAFTAYLTPDMSIFKNNTDIYLGLAVDGGAEMSPRLKMSTVPYAAVAGNAASLEGKSAADFAPSDYAPDWSSIQNVPADLADGDDDTTYTGSGAVSIDANNNIDSDELVLGRRGPQMGRKRLEMRRRRQHHLHRGRTGEHRRQQQDQPVRLQ